MILNKTLEIKLGSRNINHYNSLGYVLPDKPFGKTINVNIEHLSENSWVEVTARCYYCNKIKNIKYYRYRTITSNNTNFSCSNKCSVTKRKETQLKRYGVDSYTKTDEYKKRCKDTCLKKYGVTNVFQATDVKDRIKKTNLEKYGSDNISRSVLNHSNTIIGKHKNYIKYIANNISLFRCDKGHDYKISSDLYHSRIKNNTVLCTECNPLGEHKSSKQIELLDFIIQNYDNDVISNYRSGLEIDIYLPKLNLGFEFNGLYWHSEVNKEKNYHLNKTNFFKEKGIQVIHIWEDDWDYKKDIIKSQILNILGKSNSRIYARMCRIEVVNSKVARKFLNENHIQGFVNSSLKLGLFYNDELVSIMTFDHYEGRKKMEEYEWNLNRFCSVLNTNVIGGASKILNLFLKNYNVKRLLSYSDLDWSVGNLYLTIGFTVVGVNNPDYKYIFNKKRVHKSKFKKDKLGIKGNSITETKYMADKGILKIYDCGKLKYEYTKIN